MKEFFYPSRGAGQIHACRWEPQDTPIAVLQLVHGVAEYVERYDDFARFLTDRGILVVGEDHMGHGKSIGDDCPQGYFVGGWDAAVADTYALYARTREEFPRLPYFLLGHSMGSFMARTFLIRYPNSGLRGAIIMGTGWQSKAVLQAGSALTGLLAQGKGARNVSERVQKLMFGAYNAPFPEATSSFDWLCANKAALADYLADPLCGFPITNGLARDMIVGLRFIQKPRNLDRMIKTLPVLFTSGDHDPVGNMGKGVLTAHLAFEKAGMLDTQVKLYPGLRHEILNETAHDEIYADILHWILKRIGNYR